MPSEVIYLVIPAAQAVVDKVEWGSVANWAAAAGSIFASCVALWIASRSRKQYVKVQFTSFQEHIVSSSDLYGKITFVNNGHIPVKIKDIWLAPCIPFKTGKLLKLNTSLDPAIQNGILEYGQEFVYEINGVNFGTYNHELDIKKWYFNFFAKYFRFDIIVETTVSCIRVRMNKELTSVLLPALKEEEAQEEA